MTIVRRTNQYPSLFDRFLESDFFDWSSKQQSANKYALPAVNVFERSKGFLLEVAAPGFEKTDFLIETKDDILTISCEKTKQEDVEEIEGYAKREFDFQAFRRSFNLSPLVNSDQISASYESGILKVWIPKREIEQPKEAKKIAVL